MIKNIISKTRMLNKKPVDFENISYWESTTDEEVMRETLEYWKEISEWRKKSYSQKEIATISNTSIINVLFAEKIMGWNWSDTPIVYIEEFMPGGFLISEKVKTNISHYTYKSLPVILPDFTSEDFTLKIMDKLKIHNVKYGLQPVMEGYEVYCEKHHISIFGKTLGEVICKLALLTLSEFYA